MASDQNEHRRWLRLDQILLPPDRLRPVSDEAAEGLAVLIKEQGQLSPIAVYISNAAERPFTLIYGARRLRAMKLLGEERIEVVLRRKEDARMLEIIDNLNVVELSQIERADYLFAFRRCWEDRHGEIKKGGDRKSKVHDEPLIKNSYFNELNKKFAISKSTAMRLHHIAKHLHPDLKETLRYSPVAKDQSALLKLAKLEPVKQRQAVIALRHGQDVKAALALVNDRPAPTKMTAVEQRGAMLAKLVDLWSRCDAATKDEFFKLIS